MVLTLRWSWKVFTSTVSGSDWEKENATAIESRWDVKEMFLDLEYHDKGIPLPL